MMNQKGQSLIEAVVALGAAALIVSAMAIAVITAISNADYGKYQNLATNYAQQGIEILKQQSETDWNSFSGKLGVDWCLNADSTVLSPASGCSHLSRSVSPNVPPYVRQVNLLPPDSSCPDVGSIHGIVNVYWNDGKCQDVNNYYCHEVKLDSCFANINPGKTL